LFSSDFFLPLALPHASAAVLIMPATRSRKQSSRDKGHEGVARDAQECGEYELQLVRRIRRRLREAGVVSEEGLKIFRAEIVQNQVVGGGGGEVSALGEPAAAKVEGKQDEVMDLWKMDGRDEEDDEARRKKAARILMCLRSDGWEEKEKEKEKEEETHDEMAEEETDERERMKVALSLTSLRYGGRKERPGERKRADGRRTAEEGMNRKVEGNEGDEDAQMTANILMLDDFLKIDPLMYWAVEEWR
jgi:hypothetical protein